MHIANATGILQKKKMSTVSDAILRDSWIRPLGGLTSWIHHVLVFLKLTENELKVKAGTPTLKSLQCNKRSMQNLFHLEK